MTADAARLKLAVLADRDRCRQELQRLAGERERLVGAAGLVTDLRTDDTRTVLLPTYWRVAIQRNAPARLASPGTNCDWRVKTA